MVNRDFLMVQWLKLCVSNAEGTGALVGKLRSHGRAKKKKSEGVELARKKLCP